MHPCTMVTCICTTFLQILLLSVTVNYKHQTHPYVYLGKEHSAPTIARLAKVYPRSKPYEPSQHNYCWHSKNKCAS